MHTPKGNTSKVAQIVRNTHSICELRFLSLYVNFGNKPSYTIFESFLINADFHCTWFWTFWKNTYSMDR